MTGLIIPIFRGKYYFRYIHNGSVSHAKSLWVWIILLDHSEIYERPYVSSGFLAGRLVLEISKKSLKDL